jgi:hypothetical protein
MNTEMRKRVLEYFKQEFLLLAQEGRFVEADKLYQKYKKLKREVKDAQPPSQMATQP